MGANSAFMQINHDLFCLSLGYATKQNRVVVALVENVITEEELSRESSHELLIID